MGNKAVLTEDVDVWPSSVRNYCTSRREARQGRTLITLAKVMPSQCWWVEGACWRKKNTVSNWEKFTGLIKGEREADVDSWSHLKGGERNKSFPSAHTSSGSNYVLVHFRVPVVRRGEGCHHHIFAVDVDDVRHSLQNVEVEVGVAGNGAVEAWLEERGPLFLQHTRRAAAVILANPGHPRKYHLRKNRNAQLRRNAWVSPNSWN